MSDIQTLYESIYELNVYLHMKDQHAEERKLLPIPTIYDDHHHYRHDHHHHPHDLRHHHHHYPLQVFTQPGLTERATHSVKVVN